MTEEDTRPPIICPLSLMIMTATDGERGAIQRYRCVERGDGYESRPQKSTDKRWAYDFFVILRGERGKMVKLSGGQPTMIDDITAAEPQLIEIETESGRPEVQGLGYPEDAKAFKFTQADGEAAFDLACRLVKAGQLRAPRNWDRASFAEHAGITLEELRVKYPELYKTEKKPAARTSAASDEPIEELGSSLFTGGLTSEAPTPPAAQEKEETPEEDEDFPVTEFSEDDYEESETPSYAVTAEAEEVEDLNLVTDSFKKEGADYRTFVMNEPSSYHILRVDTTHTKALQLEDEHGQDITLYRVQHGEKSYWMEEGLNVAAELEING